MTITIEMFGGLTLRIDNKPPVSRFRSQRTASLLAYLACHRKKPHAREVLAGMFWPDSDAAQGRANVSVALTSLRKLLEPPGVPMGTYIISDPISVSLSPLVVTDTELFESLLSRAARLPAGDDTASEYRQKAVELYHGALVPGIYDDWARDERARLDALAATALCTLAQEALARGDRATATTLTRRGFEANESCRNLSSELLALLPRQLREGQRRSEADYFKRGGGRPSVETFQETPPPRMKLSESFVPASPGIFMAPPTPLFGRERERERAGEFLRNPAVRILTLAGPGGVGKTRLTHAITLDLPAMLPGARVCAAPVADVRTADGLISALAAAIGPVSGDTPSDSVLTVDAVARALTASPSRVILIVDNLEQVAVEATPILRALVGLAPNLTCVVTSRQLLPPDESGIIPVGERILQVEPLPIPPATLLDGTRESGVPIEAQLESWSSVALFVDRAKRNLPNFVLNAANAAAVGMVVRRLEGLPLAIELVAARSQRFTPAHLLDSLSLGFDDVAALGARTKAHRESVFARHDSLRQTIQWSFDLLTAERKRMFAALSVFRGGFTADEAIGTLAQYPGSDAGVVFDSVAELCDASLLRRVRPSTTTDAQRLQPPRYEMLEPLREFASQQLSDAEHATLREKHASCYRALAVQATRHLQKHGAAWWLQRGSAERENFRAALTWASETQTGDAARLGVTLATELNHMYVILGYVAEGRQLLRVAMQHPLAVSSVDIAAEALAQNRAGIVAMNQGDARDAAAHYEKALQLWRSVGDKAGVVGALHNLGIIAANEQRLDEAWPLFVESLAVWRALGAECNVAITTANLGNLAILRNDLASARRYIEEAIPLALTAGDNRGAAASHRNLAEVNLREGDADEAMRQYVTSLELSLPLMDIPGCATGLLGLAAVAQRSGKVRRAARLVQTTLRAYHAMGVPPPPFFREEFPDIDFDAPVSIVDTEDAAHAVLIMSRLELEVAADEADRERNAPVSRRISELLVSNGR